MGLPVALCYLKKIKNANFLWRNFLIIINEQVELPVGLLTGGRMFRKENEAVVVATLISWLLGAFTIFRTWSGLVTWTTWAERGVTAWLARAADISVTISIARGASKGLTCKLPWDGSDTVSTWLARAANIGVTAWWART